MSKHSKKVAVIGLGRFGVSMVETLVESNFEVLAIDIDEDIVQKNSNICDHVVQADCTNEETIKELGIDQFDIVVVAIGRDTQSNLMTSLLLVDQNGTDSPYIIAKSESTIQGKLLRKIGVHRVIYPEKDMAIRVAHSISSNVIEFIEISAGLSLVECKVPDSMCDKKLSELNTKNKHRVSILAVKRHEDLILPPFPDIKTRPDDILIAIGPMEGIEKLKLLE